MLDRLAEINEPSLFLRSLTCARRHDIVRLSISAVDCDVEMPAYKPKVRPSAYTHFLAYVWRADRATGQRPLKRGRA